MNRRAHRYVSVGSQQRRETVAAAFALAFAACGSSEESTPWAPEGPWVTHESASVVMHARPDDGLACAQQLTEIALDVVTLWDYLAVPDTARGPVEWYRYVDQDDFDENGPRSCDGAACALGPVMHSTVQVLEHELVHAALQGMGHPPPLFTEGVAVALSCSPREGTLIDLPSTESWRDLLSTRSNRQGAELVTHLLKEYPPEKFRDLYDTLDRGAGANDVAATFLTLYGTSLDDVWTQVQGDPNRTYCFPLWACQGPVSEPGFHELGATCGSARSALRLADATAWLLAVDEGVLWMRPCDAVSSDGLLEYALVPGHADTLFFSANRSFAVQGFSADRATFSLDSVRGQFAASCDEAVPELVSPSDYERDLYVAPVQQPVFLAYEVSAPAVVSWRGNHQSLIAGEDPWTIEACLDCQDGQLSNCSGPAPSLEVVDSVWLKLAWQENVVQDTLLATLRFTPMTSE